MNRARPGLPAAAPRIPEPVTPDHVAGVAGVLGQRDFSALALLLQRRRSARGLPRGQAGPAPEPGYRAGSLATAAR
jgi:hypothetical protein